MPELMDGPRHLLVAGTDEELSQWYLDMGCTRLRVDFNDFTMAYTGSPQRDRDFLLPFMRRLARVMEEEYEIGYGSWLVDFLPSIPLADMDRMNEFKAEREELRCDLATPKSLIIQRFREIQEYFHKRGHVAFEAVLLADIGQLEADMDQDVLAYASFQEALKLCEQVGHEGMVCQILGVLSSLARDMGDDDASDEFLDRQLVLAKKCRMAHHAGRVEEFRGTLAAREGRLGSAYLHFREARDLCRRFKGGDAEVRYINNLIVFYKKLGCWKMVRGLLDQVGELKLGTSFPDWDNTLSTLTIAKAEALFEEGDIEGSLALSADGLAGLSPRPYSEVYAWAVYYHAKLLLKASRLDEALSVIDRGIEHSVENNVPGPERALRLAMVETMEKQGRVQGAWNQLQRVRWDISNSSELIPDNVRDEALLGVRLSRVRFGDGPQLAQAIVGAFQLLQRRISVGQPSAHTYLELQSFDEFRWIVHELLADDPLLGYEFDMAWRGLSEVGTRGVGLAPGARFDDAKAAVRGWIASRDAWVPEEEYLSEVTHLVFVVSNSEIIRWRRTGSRVGRTVLAWDPGAMRETVAAVLAEISQPPASRDGVLSVATQDGLGLLGRMLIPGDILDEWAFPGRKGKTDLLWVSADDALTQIPFSTFDLDPSAGYRPLLESTDIGYLRFFDPHGYLGREPKTGSLVVGDPKVAPDLKRRLGGVAPLPGAREEAIAVAEVWKDSKLLLGGEASKLNIMKHLGSACRVYVAAHHIGDSATPYIRFIPLAAGDDVSDLAGAVLEAADFLPVDLHGCELVVLSGCSSGAPYVDGSSVAPGFGEGFLDAGCAKTVQTLWRVEDQVAPEFLKSVLWPLPGGSGSSQLVRALGDSRRMIFGKVGEKGHPFYWATFQMMATSR